MRILAHAASAIALIAASPSPAYGQPANPSVSVIDKVKSGANAALAWFIELRGPIDQVVAAEKRDQLVEAMSDLSLGLYGIEQDKDLLLRQLRRPAPNANLLRSRAAHLESQVRRIRLDLRNIGPLLREEHRSGGQRVEAELAKAVGAKEWIHEVSDIIDKPERRASLIQEGTAALTALRAANAELAVLIRRLKE